MINGASKQIHDGAAQVIESLDQIDRALLARDQITDREVNELEAEREELAKELESLTG